MAFHSSANLIAPTVKLKGNMSLKGDLYLNGNFKGCLRVKGTLQIGQKSQVTGQVKATRLILDGHLKGTAKTAEELHILPSGVMNGDIITHSFCLEAGGRLKGSCFLTSAKKR